MAASPMHAMPCRAAALPAGMGTADIRRGRAPTHLLPLSLRIQPCRPLPALAQAFGALLLGLLLPVPLRCTSQLFLPPDAQFLLESHCRGCTVHLQKNARESDRRWLCTWWSENIIKRICGLKQKAEWEPAVRSLSSGRGF